MRLLVNGASNNVGPSAWPYKLQKLLDCELTNLSVPGCANDYVHDTTINELGKQQYDLVIIMWPSIPLRVDWKVDNVHQFGSDAWTSQFHKDQCPEAEDDWVMGGSHIVDESMEVPRENRSELSKKFADFYSVVKAPQLMRSALIKMVSVHGVLKSLNIPFVFTYTAPVNSIQRYRHIENMMDKDCFYDGEYMTPMCVRKGYFDPNDPMKHATEPGHIEYARLMYDYLKRKGHV